MFLVSRCHGNDDVHAKQYPIVLYSLGIPGGFLNKRSIVFPALWLVRDYGSDIYYFSAWNHQRGRISPTRFLTRFLLYQCAHTALFCKPKENRIWKSIASLQNRRFLQRDPWFFCLFFCFQDGGRDHCTSEFPLKNAWNSRKGTW